MKETAEKSAKTSAGPQRDVGARVVVQPKLSVGAPGDRYEQEADLMAGKVMRMKAEEEPAVQRMPLSPLPFSISKKDSEDELQRKPVEPEQEKQDEVQRKEIRTEAALPPVQAKQTSPLPVSLTAPTAAPSGAGSAPVSTTLSPVQQSAGGGINLKAGEPEKNQEHEAEEKEEMIQRIPQKQWALPNDPNAGTPAFQRTAEKEAVPDVQGKTEQPPPALQRTPAGGLATSDSFATRLQSAGSGEPLPQATRQNMEGAFSADFSNVRVHTGSEAVQLSTDIGARAFTHRNNIFFNKGEFNPASSGGQFLLAHELTHTLQQGAAVQRAPETAPTAPQAEAGFFNSASKLLGEVSDRAMGGIQNLPGYFLLSVILGSNPITGKQVEQNGMNFIRGFLLLLPDGEQKYKQLSESRGLKSATQWMESEIVQIRRLFGDRFEAAYERAKSLSFGDFEAVVKDAIAYAERLALKVLIFIRQALLDKLAAFIRNKTRAYPLLRALLGRDPVTGEEVPYSIENILQGFLMLTEAGEAYYKKLVETETLAKGVAWLRGQLATLPTAAEVIGAFSKAWSSFNFDDLADPNAAFERIYNILSHPVEKILAFVVNVGRELLRFIKEAMLNLLRQHANGIRGYRLLTVLIGKDPVTNTPVEPSARNILNGFVELVAGPEQFKQIEESGAIDRMLAWIDGVAKRLGISFQMIRDLFIGIWNTLTIKDLLAPPLTFVRVLAEFEKPLKQVLTFVVEVIKKIVEVMLDIMQVPVDVGRQIVARVMAAYEFIKRDPVAFFINLLRAVKQGFVQFFGKIGEYLLKGLTGWLFSELKSAGIQPPQDMNPRAIVGFVLDVLGITMERIWQKLAEHPSIGPERVARLRGMIDRLSGIWTIIQEVMRDGPGALWKHLQEQLANLWDTVLEQVRSWVTTQIVDRVARTLLKMLDPSGIMAVITSIQQLYKAIQTFVQRLREIMNIINSFVGGILEIAQGNIVVAANTLESTMANAMPTVIAFLANQVGLSGLGHRIGLMIEKVRGIVDKALTWLVNKMVQVGKGLLEMGKKAVGAVLGWLRIRREFNLENGEVHEIFFEGEESAPKVMVASKAKKGIENLIKDRRGSLPKLTKQQDDFLTDTLAKKKQMDIFIHDHMKKGNNTILIEREIETLLDEIKTLLAKGDVFGQSDLPLSKVTYSMEGGKASSVIARPLTKLPGNTKGSRPINDDNIPLGWLHIRAVIGPNIANSNWVKAHLLNDNLHGPGNVHWNLVPATKQLNTAMSEGPEEKAKEEKDKGEILFYESKVTHWHEDNKNPAISRYFPKVIEVIWGYMDNPAKGSLEVLKFKQSFESGPPPFSTFSNDPPSINTMTQEDMKKVFKGLPNADNMYKYRNSLPNNSFRDLAQMYSALKKYYNNSVDFHETYWPLISQKYNFENAFKF